MRTPIRLAAIPAVAALAILAACGSESATTPTATTAVAATTSPGASDPVTTDPQSTEQPATGDQIELTLKVGVDDSPTRIEQVPLGASVVLAMQSDSDEEYHLHDYDLEDKAAAGVEVVWEFTADRAGTFELESHTTDEVLLVLQVG